MVEGDLPLVPKRNFSLSPVYGGGKCICMGGGVEVSAYAWGEVVRTHEGRGWR